MKVIDAKDVNEAYYLGLRLIMEEGKSQNSRAGKVITLEEPLTIVYQNPLQRVLFDPSRDANPFFHIFEALWLLAGRNDARWLDRFVSDFSSRFAEEDGHLHGSYGYRWRKHFDVEGGGTLNFPDQLNEIVHLLRVNPDDRRVVLTMWDPVADLGATKKDVPCNLMALPRIRYDAGLLTPVLDLTVFNRSNDFLWGMTGANAVQFSVLQEYLAGRIGVGVGRLTQVSTNAHVYLEHVKKLGMPQVLTHYPDTRPMGTNWGRWDEDLATFMAWTEDWEGQPPTYPHNPWFEDTAQPLFAAHAFWKSGQRQDALEIVKDPLFSIAPDWRAATIAWMERRLARMAKKQEVAHG